MRTRILPSLAHTHTYKKRGGGNPCKLTQGDLLLIETLYRERPTISLREVYDNLIEFGDIPNGTSFSGIARALSSHMLSGLKYSWKKVSRVANERFTVENMAYTQLFIDYLHMKNPFQLKFFDECGLK